MRSDECIIFKICVNILNMDNCDESRLMGPAFEVKPGLLTKILLDQSL
jgi:hypothetical protein